MKKEKSPYQEAVTYLYSLQKFGIKFGLSKTANLLEALGNPHKGQQYIHIAGTNGKGSVGAFLSSILKEAGLKVGLYSSPHLLRFTERFRINGREITDEKAAFLIEKLRNVFVHEDPPTFFEATTAMALACFAGEKTDIAIMETGMGGRLDATNVIDPIVSVITNIAMEHQFFLGNSLLQIAGEKGGIIKKGVDVITGATQPPVINLFQSICSEKGATLFRVGRDIRYRTSGSGFHYYGMGRRLNGLELNLKGKFQRRNAAMAIAVIERLGKKGFKVSSGDIREGLKNSVWPGRMQVMAQNPTILLDGGHNAAAMRALAESIKAEFQYRRLILVLGVMKDKDIGQMLKGIVPQSDYVIYTRPVYYRAADPEILMAKAASLETPGEVVSTLAQAIDRAKEMAGPQDLIVVCGSLFTVGEAMACIDPETNVPDTF